MKRHTVNLPALFFGITIAAIAVVALITTVRDANTDPQWDIAAVSIVLGVVALVVTFARAHRDVVAEPLPSPEDPAG